MNATTASIYRPPLPYIATITNVQEITLRGQADGAFWQDKLAAVEMQPVLLQGRAEVSISSIFGRFMGWPFRELVIVVLVESQELAAPEGALYLVHAFNSSRVLGWMERKLFQTPYFYGNLANHVGPPASIRLPEGKELLLEIAMGAEPSPPIGSEDESWTGPIFLPPPPHTPASARNVFFANLRGRTETYSFRADHDRLAFTPAPHAPVLSWLLESGFTGAEWKLRRRAVHARTKTMARHSRA